MLKRLHRSFKGIDLDKSGSLSLSELKALPQLANNPLVEFVFRAFDADKNGVVDFAEFVSWLDMFIMQLEDIEKRYQFIFDIYDMDGDGFISNGDLYTSLRIMVGDNLQPKQLQQLVDRTILQGDTTRDGKLTYQEWRRMVSDTAVHERLILDL